LTAIANLLDYSDIKTNERTNEVHLPMNGVTNDWLPVEAEDPSMLATKKKIKRN